MTDWIYDEENYPNFFSIGLEHAERDEYHYFEISPRVNDILRLKAFIDARKGDRLVGFNNLGYDYPVLHDILTTDPQRLTLEQIYAKTMSIINSNDRFGPGGLWESDHIIKQIDLYKLNHYDNVNKRTSLKQLEIAMRMESIEDLPFEPGTVLTFEQMDVVKSYMRHDIRATKQFYHHNEWAIKLRESLSDTYGKNLLNASDSKIGSSIFVSKLQEAGIETHETVESWDAKTCSIVKKKQPKGTHRSSINLGDVVFPCISFERPEFNALLDWLRQTTITETKGALSNIKFHPELFKYLPPNDIKIPDLTVEDVGGAFKPVKNRKTRYSTCLKNGVELDLSRFENVTCDSLSIMVDGFQFDLGTGGIHGSIESQIVKSDDEYVILDYDFASYYPHLSFRHNVYPHHLSSDFCRIYEGMYKERKSYPKSNPINYALKIALNGSYGNSNSVYSPFYDPKFTMTITINGQLFLCMLAEQLLKVPGLTVVQVNTDGITVRSPRKYHDHVRSIVKWIEGVSHIEMEEAIYSQMAIRDVNNYIAVYAESGKAKRKGAYAYTKDKQWHQDQSAMIVPMAAEAALIHGVDIREFIMGHLDIYDFMIMAKVPRTNRLELGREPIQKTSRVYVSKNGSQLVKHMPPLAGKDNWRPQNIMSGWNISVANNINDADFMNIDYDYYVAEAEKLVKPLLNQ